MKYHGVRSNPKSLTKINFPNCRDIILRYSKSEKYIFNQVFGTHDPEYVRKTYRHKDPDGRRYTLMPLLNPNTNRPNLTYEFLGVTRVWRWTKERMQKAYEEGLIVQVKPNSAPRYKKYLDESKGKDCHKRLGGYRTGIKKGNGRLPHTKTACPPRPYHSVQL